VASCGLTDCGAIGVDQVTRLVKLDAVLLICEFRYREPLEVTGIRD